MRVSTPTPVLRERGHHDRSAPRSLSASMPVIRTRLTRQGVAFSPCAVLASSNRPAAPFHSYSLAMFCVSAAAFGFRSCALPAHDSISASAPAFLADTRDTAVPIPSAACASRRTSSSPSPVNELPVAIRSGQSTGSPVAVQVTRLRCSVGSNAKSYSSHRSGILFSGPKCRTSLYSRVCVRSCSPNIWTPPAPPSASVIRASRSSAANTRACSARRRSGMWRRCGAWAGDLDYSSANVASPYELGWYVSGASPQLEVVRIIHTPSRGGSLTRRWHSIGKRRDPRNPVRMP